MAVFGLPINALAQDAGAPPATQDATGNLVPVQTPEEAAAKAAEEEKAAGTETLPPDTSTFGTTSPLSPVTEDTGIAVKDTTRPRSPKENEQSGPSVEPVSVLEVAEAKSPVTQERSEQISQWPAGDWKDVQSADMDGNGIPDMVGRDEKTGQWIVTYNFSDRQSETKPLTQWSITNWTDVSTVDVNGDGRADILGRVADSNTWWASVSDANGEYSPKNLGTWSTEVNWADFKTADINKDGRADILGRVDGSNSWWASVSDANGEYSPKNLGTWSTEVVWTDFQTADINGDGQADILGRVEGSNTWWAAVSDSSGAYSPRNLGTWSTEVTWADFQTADINGDGRADILGRTESSNTWWAAVSDPNNPSGEYSPRNLGTWSPDIVWRDFKVADINGDGRADILGRVEGSNTWWAAMSDPNNFTGKYFPKMLGVWSANVNWTDFKLTDINGDGTADLVGRNAETGEWWSYLFPKESLVGAKELAAAREFLGGGVIKGVVQPIPAGLVGGGVTTIFYDADGLEVGKSVTNGTVAPEFQRTDWFDKAGTLVASIKADGSKTLYLYGVGYKTVIEFDTAGNPISGVRNYDSGLEVNVTAALATLLSKDPMPQGEAMREGSVVLTIGESANHMLDLVIEDLLTKVDPRFLKVVSMEPHEWGNECGMKAVSGSVCPTVYEPIAGFVTVLEAKTVIGNEETVQIETRQYEYHNTYLMPEEQTVSAEQLAIAQDILGSTVVKGIVRAVDPNDPQAPREIAFLDGTGNIVGMAIDNQIITPPDQPTDGLAKWTVEWYDAEGNMLAEVIMPDKTRLIYLQKGFGIEGGGGLLEINSTGRVMSAYANMTAYGNLRVLPANEEMLCPLNGSFCPSPVASFTFNGEQYRAYGLPELVENEGGTFTVFAYGQETLGSNNETVYFKTVVELDVQGNVTSARKEYQMNAAEPVIYPLDRVVVQGLFAESCDITGPCAITSPVMIPEGWTQIATYTQRRIGHDQGKLTGWGRSTYGIFLKPANEVPEGWTVSKSNPNFAFQILTQYVGPGVSAKNTLRVMDLKTREQQDLAVGQFPYSALGAVYDVSPDGSTVIFSVGGMYASGHPTPYTTTLQRIGDSTAKLDIPGELKAMEFMDGNKVSLEIRDVATGVAKKVLVDLTTLKIDAVPQNPVTPEELVFAQSILGSQVVSGAYHDFGGLAGQGGMDFFNSSGDLVGTERHAVVPDAPQNWADAAGNMVATVRTFDGFYHSGDKMNLEVKLVFDAGNQISSAIAINSDTNQVVNTYTYEPPAGALRTATAPSNLDYQLMTLIHNNATLHFIVNTKTGTVDNITVDPAKIYQGGYDRYGNFDISPDGRYVFYFAGGHYSSYGATLRIYDREQQKYATIVGSDGAPLTPTGNYYSLVQPYKFEGNLVTFQTNVEYGSDPIYTLDLSKDPIEFYLGSAVSSAELQEANAILGPYGAAAAATGTVVPAADNGNTETKFYSDAAKTQQVGSHVVNAATGTDEWYKVDPKTGVKTLVQRSASATEIAEAQGIIGGIAKGIMKSAIGTAGTHIVSFLSANGGLAGQHVYTTADPLGHWSVGSTVDNQVLARQYLTTTAAAADSAQPWKITDAENFLRTEFGYKAIQIVKAVEDTRPSLVDGIVYTRFYDSNGNLVCLKAEGKNINGDPINSFVKTIGWNKLQLDSLIQVVGEPDGAVTVTDSVFLNKANTMFSTGAFDRAVKITSYTKTLGNLPAGGYGDIVLFYKGNILVGRYVQNEAGDDTDDTWEVVTGGAVKQTVIIQAASSAALLGNTDILGTTNVKTLVRYANPNLNASYPSEQWRKDSASQTPEYNRMIEYYSSSGQPLGWRKLAVTTDANNVVTALALDNWFSPDGILMRRLASSSEINEAKAALASASGTTIGYVDTIPSLITGNKTAKFFSDVAGYMTNKNMTIAKLFKEAGNLDKDGNGYDDLNGLSLVSWSIVPSITGDAAMDLLVRQTAAGSLPNYTGTGYIKNISYAAGPDAETVGVLSNALGAGASVTVTGKYVIVMQDYPDASKTQEVTLFYNGTQLLARKISKDSAETLDDRWYYVKPDRTEILVRGEVERGQGDARWGSEVDDADWFFRTGIGGYQVKKAVAWFSLGTNETRLYFFKQNQDPKTQKYYYSPLAAHQINDTVDRWGAVSTAAPDFSLKAIVWATDKPLVQTSGADIENARKAFLNFDITRSVTVTYGSMVTTIYYNDNATSPIDKTVGIHTVSTTDANMNFWNPRYGAGDWNSARLLTASELTAQSAAYYYFNKNEFSTRSVAWARAYIVSDSADPNYGKYRTDCYDSSNQLIGYNIGTAQSAAAQVYTNRWYRVIPGTADQLVLDPVASTDTAVFVGRIAFGFNNLVISKTTLPPPQYMSSPEVSVRSGKVFYWLIDPTQPNKLIGFMETATKVWYYYDSTNTLQGEDLNGDSDSTVYSTAWQNSMASAILNGVSSSASLTSDTVKTPWTATTGLYGRVINFNGRKTQFYYNSTGAVVGYAEGQAGTPYYYNWYKADGTYCQANREYNTNAFSSVQSEYAAKGISISGGVTLVVNNVKADYFFDASGNVVGKQTYSTVNGLMKTIRWKWDTAQTPNKWVIVT